MRQRDREIVQARATQEANARAKQALDLTPASEALKEQRKRKAIMNKKQELLAKKHELEDLIKSNKEQRQKMLEPRINRDWRNAFKVKG